MRKKLLYFFLFIVIFIPVDINSEARVEYGEPLGVYEDVVKIVSFTQKWKDEEKLKEVHDELLNNFHGEEIDYLEGVYLYPDSPEGVSGLYMGEFDYDENGNYINVDTNYIEIFDCKTYSNFSDFARKLSHEYGHHYTTYYFIKKENRYFSSWKDTRYAEVRDIKDHEKIKYYNSLNNENYKHKWDIMEILAEDYVQLLGSKLAKKSTDYKDVIEKIEIGEVDEKYYFNSSFNLLPQENMDIELAADVEGLYEYFLNLSGYTAVQKEPENMPELEILEKEKILTFEDLKEYNYYNFTKNEFEHANKRYAIGWDKVDKNYEYTLIAHPKGNSNFPDPIKTVNDNESLVAYFGSSILKDEEGNKDIIVNSYEGEYIFRLLLKDENNFIYEADRIEIDFGEIQEQFEQIFSDITKEHWVSSYITDLVRKDIIEGYGDDEFKPDSKISRAEFLTLVLKTVKNIEIEETEEEHWFKKQGYFKKAKELNLIRESDYGKDFRFFEIDKPITREEMAFIVSRVLELAGLDINKDYRKYFTDADQIIYKKELNIASKYGVITGYPDKSFRPSGKTKRSEAAIVISKLYNLTKGFIIKERSKI